VARSKNIIDIEFLPKGLHDMGEKIMSEGIQKAIDNVDTEKFSAILLGYGLCNYGVKGLKAKIPIVIPIVHDCIALFFGSRERYMDYFNKNPGTWYQTSGWLERGDFGLLGDDNIMSQLGIDHRADYKSYIEKYGEENAEYLLEMLDWTKNYKKATFIDMGVGDSDAYEVMAKTDAKCKNFEYERVDGDMRLFQELVDGNWNTNDFLIIPPGSEITPTFDEAIMTHKPIGSSNK